MKICKKLLAVLLSVLMIASVVIIPTVADTSVAEEQYISLLDLSNIAVGTSVAAGESAAIPAGLDALGVSKITKDIIGSVSHTNTEGQSIVAVTDPKDADQKGWDVNLRAAGGSGSLGDIKNEFAVKFAVPEEYAAKITSISVDMDVYSDVKVGYTFGLLSETYGSQRKADMSSWKDGTVAVVEEAQRPAAVEVTRELTSLYKIPRGNIYKGLNPATDGQWTREDAATVTDVYLIIANDKTASEIGHVTINDIGITIDPSIKGEDEEDENKPFSGYISLMDLTNVEVGTSVAAGESAAIPAGLDALGISKITSSDITSVSHTNTDGQSIVEVTDEKDADKKGWDVNLRAVGGNGNLGDIKNEFAVKFAVPEEYAGQITHISVDMDVYSDKKIGYTFGVLSGTYGSQKKDGMTTWKEGSVDGVPEEAGRPVGVSNTRELTTLYKQPTGRIYKGTEFSDGLWTREDAKSITYVYLIIANDKTASEIGHVTIKDIGITVDGSIDVGDDDEDDDAFSGYISLMDLTNVEVGTSVAAGESAAIPAGLDEVGISKITSSDMASVTHANTDGQSIVEVTDEKDADKKGWDVNLREIGGNGNLSAIKNEFAVKFAVPEEYAGQITHISVDMDVYSDKKIGYTFGVINETHGSQKKDAMDTWKEGSVDGVTEEAGRPVGISNTRELTALYKQPIGNIFKGANPSDGLWTRDDAKSITYVYLIIANDKTASEIGHVVIKDIGITVDGSIDVGGDDGDGDDTPEYDGYRSLLDLTNIAVGTSVESGVSGAIPAGLDALGISPITPDYITNVTHVANEGQSIVAVTDPKDADQKGWDINLRAVGHNGNLDNIPNEFAVKFAIPAEYAGKIESVKVDLDFYNDVKMGYSYGVLNGTYGSMKKEDMGTSWKESSISGVADESSRPYVVSASRNITAFYKHPYGNIHKGGATTDGMWSNADAETVTYVYLIIANDKTASEINHVTIKDVSVTLRNDEAPVEGLDLSGATGAKVSKYGIEFAASPDGSNLTAKIPVAAGTFNNVSAMKLKFDSDAVADYSVSLLGTDDNGIASHWKWGYTDATDSVTATARNYSFSVKLAGYNASGNKQTIHKGEGEGGANCQSCTPSIGGNSSSGHGNSAITPTEKATIHTIVIRVFNNTGAADRTVTLKSITLEYAGNTITSVINERDEGSGKITIDKSTAFAGDEVTFRLTVTEGYYVSNISVVDHLGNAVAFANKGNNDPYQYSFKMPENVNVVVNVTFGVIEGKTVISSASYADKDVVLDFSILVEEGLVYNSFDDAMQTLDTYGVIIASNTALEKYGYSVDDLTVEFVAEMNETGHHLSNYIYVLDSANAILTAETSKFINFSLKMTDVSVEARREPIFAMTTYATFTDEGSNPAYEPNYVSLDTLVYGYELQTEFSAYYGINYSGPMQNIPGTSDDNRIYELATWQDIKAHGFDHVRLPVELHEVVDENGKLIEDYMVKLDKVIENALVAGFSLVVDLHGYGPTNIYTDFDANKGQFLSIWEQVAERYAYLPLSVIFELINEPHTDREQNASNPDPMRPADLMQMQEEAIEIIRSVKGNEDRTIVIGTDTNLSGQVKTITEKLLNTENLIIDIHCYTPMKFTHSGASWTSDNYPAGATEYNIAEIEQKIANLAAFSEEHNIGIWMGEWGAYRPDAAKKLQYLSEFTAIMDDYGMPRCIWEYDSSWGPYANGAWRDDILAAIGLGF